MSQPPPPRLKKALEGRYELQRQVGAGGMATVYLAEDVRGRSAAVANLRSQQSDNHANYDIHPSGDRFVIAERGAEDAVVAIFNWADLLR